MAVECPGPEWKPNRGQMPVDGASIVQVAHASGAISIPKSAGSFFWAFGEPGIDPESIIEWFREMPEEAPRSSASPTHARRSD